MLHEPQEYKPIISAEAPEELKEKIGKLGVIETSVHTPPYTMHKFWARRPWRVFRELITRFTKPGDIILDPFAGGGVTLVEGLIARRRVIAVDLNPLAVKIMKHEVKPLNMGLYKGALKRLAEVIEPVASEIYAVRCPHCGGKAMAIWTEYDSTSNKPIRIYYECPICGSKGIKKPEPGDLPEPQSMPQFRRVQIPIGDKTSDLLKRGIRFFDQLYTKRNLYMVLRLKEEIERLGDPFDEDVKSFLLFTLSSTLKWASKMSHLRGSIIEGWAIHAYWIYPKYLEINVWKQFLNRAEAVLKGKSYTNRYIGYYAKEARDFSDLLTEATYMVIQADARKLPLPSESVDAVITDPPYGDNVNYAELSDYFLWLFGESAPKNEEIVINRTRGFSIHHYQQGLEEVFRECYRVLKPGGALISTFNSKDASVVGAFVYSVRKAGFKFAGVSPQPYLRAYETTFHAMQVDSMPLITYSSSTRVRDTVIVQGVLLLS
ncbi:DNA methyltransferase [Vulcanisaeta sp. JCM 14467]